jgi:uncharacterized protein
MLMKPSIYNLVYEIDGRHYLFNTFTQSLAQVATDITDLLDEKKLSLIDSASMSLLTENGFVIAEDLDELSEFLNGYDEKKKEKSLYAKLLLSGGCNFGCTYCYQATSPSPELIVSDASKQRAGMNVISIAKIKIFLIWLESQLKNESFTDSTIELFGGEPTLAIKHLPFLLNSISALSTKYAVPNKLTITTNGYLLTDEIIELLIGHSVEFQISIDGTKEIHDLRRVLKKNERGGTFDRTLEVVRKIVSLGGEELLKVRMNVDKQNIHNIEPLADLLFEVGVKYFYCARVTFRGKATSYDDLLISKEDFDAKFDYEIYKILSKYGYCDSPGSFELVGPCQVQRHFSYSFSPDLEISKCDELLEHDDYKIGYLNELGELIYTSDNYRKQIAMSPGSNEECRGCKLLPMCASGGCPVQSLNDTGSIEKNTCKSVSYESIRTKLQDIIGLQMEAFGES